jgi:hypothetical protein
MAVNLILDLDDLLALDSHCSLKYTESFRKAMNVLRDRYDILDDLIFWVCVFTRIVFKRGRHVYDPVLGLCAIVYLLKKLWIR